MLSFSFHKSGNAFGMIHFVIFWFCSYKNYDFFLPYYQLPPNAEGSAEPCETIGARVRTQVKMS